MGTRKDEIQAQVQVCSAAVIFLHMSDQHNLKLWFTNVTCDGKISSQSLQIKVTNWNQIPCDTAISITVKNQYMWSFDFSDNIAHIAYVA